MLLIHSPHDDWVQADPSAELFPLLLPWHSAPPVDPVYGVQDGQQRQLCERPASSSTRRAQRRDARWLCRRPDRQLHRGRGRASRRAALTRWTSRRGKKPPRAGQDAELERSVCCHHFLMLNQDSHIALRLVSKFDTTCSPCRRRPQARSTPAARPRSTRGRPCRRSSP